MAGISQMLIHPTAAVHESTVIGVGVEIGPGAYVGPGCVLGDGVRLLAGARVMSHTVMGCENVLHPGSVIGGDPQDRKFDPSCPGRLVIGDRNTFREGVTVNRSVGEESSTVIGDDCYLMACAHVGHNCVVADGVNMANGSSLGGHVRVGSGCFLSAGCGVHQFATLGDFVMMRGTSGASQHVPPFVIIVRINEVAGLNSVGVERGGRFTSEERVELREAYRLVYRPRVPRAMSDIVREALERQWGRAADQFLRFIHDALTESPPRARGVCGRAARTR